MQIELESQTALNYTDRVLAALGYRDGADKETHALRPAQLGPELAARAQRGDVEATRLLSHEVLELIPGFLNDDARHSLAAFIHGDPERFPHNTLLNQQAWYLENDDARFLNLLREVKAAILAYKERMSARHEYFRQPLTYSKWPGAHVGWMARTPEGFPHMLPHIHAAVVFNAVYYLEAPAADQGGLIRFGGVAHDAPEGTPAQHPQMFICPPSNSLLIFPSYLVHGVTDYISTVPRRSISMGM